MRFLALSPTVAIALLIAVGLAIVLLHLLRPPPPMRVVPSVLMWARIRRDRKRPALRWLVMLLLALGAGLSIALALSRPEVPVVAATAQRLTLILDNSPSMAARTRDGRSRWQHALEQAQALLERTGAPSEVMLLDTLGQLGASGFVHREAAVAALARLSVGAWGVARVPRGSLEGSAPVHLFTDGVAQLEVPEGAIVHSVFEAADNIAVTAFEARPLAQDPTRYEALVQVLNASPTDQRVRVLIAGGEGFAIVQDLDVRAGESIDASFDVSDFQGGVLGASVASRGDAFALDDLAYALVPPHEPKRVLLVTHDNPILGDALRNLPGVRLDVVAPEDYARARQYDAVVFDRFAPVEPPRAGALLLRPPARAWLSGQSTRLNGPRITSWNENHPVTSGIAWRNVRLAQGSLEAATLSGPDALVLASGSASGALVTAGEAHARWVKVGFALQDSNFALQADFPVFLGNALSWVSEPIPVLRRGLGTIEVALPQAQVRDGDGRPVAASTTAQGVVFEAPRPDVYTVSGPGGQVFVVANIADPRYALINRRHLAHNDANAARTSAAPPLFDVELWTLLLLLAGALLVVEWVVFAHRRGA